MSKAKCLPEYWFLDTGQTLHRSLCVKPEKPQRFASICCCAGGISIGRNKAVGDWKLPIDAIRLLGSAWTSGNLVAPLVDGKAYMKNLYDELQNLKKPAAVLLAGWQFTPNLGLEGPDSPSRKTQLLQALRDVIGRGCSLLVLAWDNIKIPTSWWDFNNRDFVKAINSEYPSGPAAAFVDANLDGTFLSHHQKEVVIYKPSGESCAYVGGIDLGIDRWDDNDHKKLKESGTFIGWHDIQVKVQGVAVMQLWANFADRWDNNNAWLVKQGESPLKTCYPPIWNPTQPGTQHVQVLRTVTPVRSGFPERTMPLWRVHRLLRTAKGDLSGGVLHIYRRAVPMGL